MPKEKKKTDYEKLTDEKNSLAECVAGLTDEKVRLGRLSSELREIGTELFKFIDDIDVTDHNPFFDEIYIELKKRFNDVLKKWGRFTTNVV